MTYLIWMPLIVPGQFIDPIGFMSPTWTISSDKCYFILLSYPRLPFKDTLLWMFTQELHLNILKWAVQWITSRSVVSSWMNSRLKYGHDCSFNVVFLGARSCESCGSCRKRSRGPSSSWATSCSSRESRSSDALSRKPLWVSLAVLQLRFCQLWWSKSSTYSSSIYTGKHSDYFITCWSWLHVWIIKKLALEWDNLKSSLSMVLFEKI